MPRGTPTSASSPDGISTATTGNPAALISAIASAYSPRTLFFKPVPKTASTISPAWLTCSVNKANFGAPISMTLPRTAR